MSILTNGLSLKNFDKRAVDTACCTAATAASGNLAGTPARARQNVIIFVNTTHLIMVFQCRGKDRAKELRYKSILSAAGLVTGSFSVVPAIRAKFPRTFSSKSLRLRLVV